MSPALAATAADASSTPTALPPGIKYVVRAEPVARGDKSVWIIHVCVFDSLNNLSASAPVATAQATPTVNPLSAHLPVVATDIQVMALAQESARILSGWSESGRAELTTHGLHLRTPALRESEVLRYAIEVETDDPRQAWQVRVRDATGPAIDVSGDPAFQCGSSGLSITAPPAAVKSGSASAPAPRSALSPVPPETIAEAVSMALSDRAAALRAVAPPRGPSVSAGHTQALLVAATGTAGLVCLLFAIILRRRQQRAA